MGIGMRAKIGIAFLSILVLVSFGFSSNQAFAGTGFPVPFPESCEDCAELDDLFWDVCAGDLSAASVTTIDDCVELREVLDVCAQECRVGGTFEGVDSTSLLVAGAQMNAAWMIPVIVSGIGFAIVIARKF